MKNSTIVQQPDLLELVFAGRNRTYGAYALRRNYPGHLARALGIGFLMIASFFGFIHLLTAAEKAAHKTVISEVVLHKLDAPKKEKTPTAPNLPKEALAPVVARNQQRLVPPVLRRDEAVADDLEQLTQDELVHSKAGIGAVNQAGNPEAPPGLPNLNTASGSSAMEYPVTEEVYEAFDVQKMPYFPGGEGELLRYLASAIRYPVLAREAGIEGPVVLSFVILTNGKIDNITVLKDPGGGCAKEAVRVLAAMPNWVPGEANGHPVKVRFYLPIRFELQ